jgi:hypothetical protein
LPPAVAALAADLATGIGEVLEEDFVSLFFYGALAFPHPPDWLLDIDFHAFVAAPTTPEQRSGLQELHARLAVRHPLAEEFDGYYVTMDDARGVAAPLNQFDLGLHDQAWALHRAHVLAGRFFLIAGNDPRAVVQAPAWSEQLAALRAELAFIEAHPQHAAFGILNSARICYSVRFNDVVTSKYAAAQWARDTLPSARAAIDAAVRTYARRETASDAAAIEAAWPVVVERARRALD